MSESGHSTLNYRDQGGSVDTIGGTLEILPGGTVLLPDTTNGKIYQLTVVNGVLTPVEV